MSRSGDAVVCRTCAPLIGLTPIASAQHSGAIAGVVPFGAAFSPTVVQGVLVCDNEVPCKSSAAFCSSASVGGLSGSSWWMRLKTVGVYGAEGSIGGELKVPGKPTGRGYGGVSATARSGAISPGASALTM